MDNKLHILFICFFSVTWLSAEPIPPCCVSPHALAQLFGCVQTIEDKIDRCLSDVDLTDCPGHVVQELSLFFKSLCELVDLLNESLIFHDNHSCSKIIRFEENRESAIEEIDNKLDDLRDAQFSFIVQVDELSRSFVDEFARKKWEIADKLHLLERIIIRDSTALIDSEATNIRRLYHELKKLIFQACKITKQRIQEIKGQLIEYQNTIESKIHAESLHTGRQLHDLQCDTCAKIERMHNAINRVTQEQTSDLANKMNSTFCANRARISRAQTSLEVQSNELKEKLTQAFTAISKQNTGIIGNVYRVLSDIKNETCVECSDLGAHFFVQFSEICQKLGLLQTDLRQMISSSFLEQQCDAIVRQGELDAKLQNFKNTISELLASSFTHLDKTIYEQFEQLYEKIAYLNTIIKTYYAQMNDRADCIVALLNGNVCKQLSDFELEGKKARNALLKQLVAFGTFYLNQLCVKLAQIRCTLIRKNVKIKSELTIFSAGLNLQLQRELAALRCCFVENNNELCQKLISTDREICVSFAGSLLGVLADLTQRNAAISAALTALEANVGASFLNHKTEALTLLSVQNDQLCQKIILIAAEISSDFAAVDGVLFGEIEPGVNSAIIAAFSSVQTALAAEVAIIAGFSATLVAVTIAALALIAASV